MSTPPPDTPAGSTRYYPNAPIVEAVIELRVDRPPGDVQAALTEAAERVKERFPQRQALMRMQMGIAATSDGGIQSLAPKREPQGWKLLSERSDRILQLKPDGVVYSHMPRYSRWETFSQEARSEWAAYVEATLPRRVTRLGLRYVNRLPLPSGAIRLEDFLNVHPQCPDDFGPLSSLILQIQVRQPMIGPKAMASIAVASEPITDPAVNPMVLDIDVFTEIDLSPTDPEIWELFERMRLSKNLLFETAITDNTRKLIA